MGQMHSVSIVMPAHRELGNLEGAVNYVSHEMKTLVQEGIISDWEIIIVDSLEKDGSSDGTPQLADQLAQANKRIRVIHNYGYVNLGHKYKQGWSVAQFDHFMMVPGKNTLHGNSLQNLLSNVPKNGIVIGYQANMSRRPLKRRIISKTFTIFMNFVFRLKLKYYNGTTVIPTQVLRKLNLDTDNFAYMAEILVILLKRCRLTYIEVPFFTQGRRKYGYTKATTWQNIISVAKTLIRLLKEVELRKNT